MPYADLPEKPTSLHMKADYGGAGRVTGERLDAHVPDIAQRHAFVSGPPALVTDLRAELRSHGAKHVHTDSFSGY